MNINNNYHFSIEQMASRIEDVSKQNKKEKVSSLNSDSKLDFKSILDDKLNQLVFSKHASLRLEKRNINLSKQQLERLNSGTMMAKEKGIKESLILLDDFAFIVNTKNNTVVTAMGSDEKKVFTNIDGAIIV